MSKSNPENASIGISEVDYLCGGGIPRSAIILVEETGAERSSYPSFYLSMKFLNDGLQLGERGVLVLTEHSMAEYFRFAPYAGIDLPAHKKSGLLSVIDAFSGYAGLTAQPLATEANVTIESPTNTVKLLDETRNLLMKSAEEGYKDRIRMVVDSFSVLMTAAGFQKCWSLLVGLVPLHKLTGCSTIVLFFPGMHVPNEVESCERLLDGVIEFSGHEIGDQPNTKNFIRIKKMRRNPFLLERTPYVRDRFDIKFQLKKHIL